jgi:uncharacterized membrane protein
MNKFIISGFILILVTLMGFYLAYLYGRRTKKFRWREYIAIIILPIISIFIFAYFIEIKIISFFLISSFLGFIWEYLVGLIYHRIFDERLWTYNRLNIHGYTSLLVIPLWGIAGVLCWFLSKMVGL